MQFLCLKGSFEQLIDETQSLRICEEKRIQADAVFVLKRLKSAVPVKCR